MEEAEREKERARRERAITKAEAALGRAKEDHDRRTKELESKRAALDRHSEAEEARWKKQKEQLQANVLRGSSPFGNLTEPPPFTARRRSFEPARRNLMESVMAAIGRAYWKGYLKLSLVTAPIALYPASSEADKTHFHQINHKAGNRLRQQMVDEETGQVVTKYRKESTSRSSPTRSRPSRWKALTPSISISLCL
jgi:hypothetical protein